MGRDRRQSALAIAALCLAGALLFPRPAYTQAGPTAAPDPTFRSDVRLVRMLVTAKNGAGDLVASLDRSSFTVNDNGVKQEIAVFERQTEQPLSVTLLIDNSLSTAKDLPYEKESMQSFLEALVKEGNPADAASLYTFNYEVTMLNTFTRKLARLEQSLRQVQPESGTSLYDALFLSTRELRYRSGRHVIIAVTDGGDTTSAKKYRDALEATQKADAVFYAIVVVPITSSSGRNTGGEHALETLAQSTGARTFYPTVGPELSRTFAEILRDLRTQYLIGYYPRGVTSGTDAFHTVQIQLPQQKDLRVSTRTGYYEDVIP
jgi:Ca-activated chloride channel family protein